MNDVQEARQSRDLARPQPGRRGVRGDCEHGVTGQKINPGKHGYPPEKSDAESSNDSGTVFHALLNSAYEYVII